MKRITPHEYKERVARLVRSSLVLEDTASIEADEKIDLYCNVHKKTFSLDPRQIRQGKDCPDCAADKRRSLAKQKFIEDAKKRHPGKYDYSRVEYLTSNKPVTIICLQPGHGPFQQSPHHHSAGHGCRKCVRRNRRTIGDFIQQARAMHGDRYVYDRAVYVSISKALVIGCQEHGDFLQKPQQHLQGSGCPKCRGVRSITGEIFLQRAVEKYGQSYDYSDFIFHNFTTKGTIRCVLHGPFQQAAKDHLRGGCLLCGREAAKKKRQRT